MTWRELPPLVTDVATQLPYFEDIHLVAGRIDDFTSTLWPEEQAAVATARDRRVREFATGRLLARCAMAQMGIEECPVPRAGDRSPQWPAHLKGSITHSGDVAIAAVARADRIGGIGVDLEDTGRVGERLFTKLFTAAEVASLRDADPRLPGLLFSAKEAGYKAVNPQVGRYIGFQEAEVDVSWPERIVRVRYLGAHEPNRLMESGTGYFCFFERYVLTVFVIPKD